MDEYTVRELLKKTSFPFLAAYQNQWIDADGNEKYFDDMSLKYLKRCKKYLIEQKGNLEYGDFLCGLKYDKNQLDSIRKIALQLYDKKLEELKRYIDK